MIISNSSTLILISKVGLTSKLLDHINMLAIPEEVYEEIIEKEEFENLLIKKEIELKRIVVKKVDTKRYKNKINQFRLDKGETSAYALFCESKGTVILTDDKELIKLCRIENIPFICAMAIVIKLYKEKVIKKEEALEKLNSLNGYGRYSKDIYKFFMDKVV